MLQISQNYVQKIGRSAIGMVTGDRLLSISAQNTTNQQVTIELNR